VIDPIERVPALLALDLPELVPDLDARPPRLLLHEEHGALADHDQIKVIAARAAQLAARDHMPRARQLPGEGLSGLPLARPLEIPHHDQLSQGHTS
jgi:hypothetical protein